MFVKYCDAKADELIVLTIATVSIGFHGPLEKRKLGPNIYVAQSYYIGIHVSDVLLYQQIPMTPLKVLIWDYFFKLVVGPLLRQYIPVHNFELKLHLFVHLLFHVLVFQL